MNSFLLAEIAIDGGILTGVGSAIAAGFAALWRVIVRRSDECEKRNATMSKALIETVKEVGDLKGRINLAEQIAPKLENVEILAEKVLETIQTQNEDS